MENRGIKPLREQGTKADYVKLRKEIDAKQEHMKPESLIKVPMCDEDMPDFLLTEKKKFKACLQALRYSDESIDYIFK